jgi:hypothetical protein
VKIPVQELAGEKYKLRLVFEMTITREVLDALVGGSPDAFGAVRSKMRASVLPEIGAMQPGQAELVDLSGRPLASHRTIV